MKANPVGRPKSKGEIADKRIALRIKPSESTRLEEMKNHTGISVGTFIKRAAFAVLDRYDQGEDVGAVLERISHPEGEVAPRSGDGFGSQVSLPTRRKLEELSRELGYGDVATLINELLIIAASDMEGTRALMTGEPITQKGEDQLARRKVG